MSSPVLPVLYRSGERSTGHRLQFHHRLCVTKQRSEEFPTRTQRLSPRREPFEDAHVAGAKGLLEVALAAFDERKARVVEMRAFGGMSVEDTAVALGVSAPTVKRDLRLAQAWLRRELKLTPCPPDSTP